MSGNRILGDLKSRPSELHVAVIGAGAAGLFAAHALRQTGARVTVFEAHSLPGGCASWFTRATPSGAVTFDVGATVVNDLHEGAPLRLALQSWGVEVPPVHRMSRMRFMVDDERFTLDTRTPSTWITSLERAFPREPALRSLFPTLAREAELLRAVLFRVPHLPVENLLDLQRNLRGGSKLFALLPRFLTGLSQSFGETLASHNASPALRRWIDMNLLITLQDHAEHVHPLWGALALFFYPLGAGSLRGGMKSLFLALTRALRDSPGCEVRFGARVTRIECDGPRLRVYEATRAPQSFDAVLSSLPRFDTARLLPDLPLFSRNESWENLRESLWGAITGYLLVRDHADWDADPFHAHASFMAPSEDSAEGNEVYFSFSARGERAPAGYRALTMSSHSQLSRWDSTASYPHEKLLVAERLRSQAQRAFPGLECQHEEYGTPRTFARYTGRREGTVGGIPLNQHWTGWHAPSQRTQHPRILQIGDTAFPGQSLLACAIGAAAAVEKLTCVNFSSSFGSHIARSPAPVIMKG